MQIDLLASQVAADSEEAVWAKVAGRVFRMGQNESRGYVRARAAAVIRQQAGAAVAARGGLDDLAKAQVAASAREQVVCRVLSGLDVRRPASRKAAA